MNRVLIAMSGGIDSSVAAVLLKEKGYDVIGVTMKLGDTKITFGPAGDSSCCSIEDVNDARSTAVKFGFPHYVVDMKGDFTDIVIDDFIKGNIKGRTPNPCILCNKEVKWGSLLEVAKNLGCDYIATGHYARIIKGPESFILQKPKDLMKDQTYFLWGLSQDQLSKTLFPLGDMTKDEVRDKAIDLGLIDLTKKKESSDLCFTDGSDYYEFMKQKNPDLVERLKDGDIVTVDGEVIGKHKGYIFYTLGQRKGLNHGHHNKVYVVDIDPKENKVIVGDLDLLDTDHSIITNVNFVRDPYPDKDYLIKVRSLDKGTFGKIVKVDGKNWLIEFNAKVKGGIAPGQSAVIYTDNKVIGGGFIR